MTEGFTERFDACVAAHGLDPAVHEGTTTLTFAELDHLSDRVVGAVLETGGVGRSPVALSVRDGTDLVVGLVGILKAGRPYVVLDPREPPGRLRMILEDAQPDLVLRGDRSVKSVPDHEAPVVDLHALGRDDASRERPPVAPTDPFSIIYTSGSTGAPKGVVRDHRSSLHGMEPGSEHRHRGSAARQGLLWSATGAGIGRSVFRPILRGATLYPFSAHEETVDSITAWLVDNRIETVSLVPTLMRAIAGVLGPGALPDLKMLRVGGEVLHWNDVASIRGVIGPDCSVANGYGTTEAGFISQFVVEAARPAGTDAVPVGYPVSGVAIAIVDESGNEVPAGEVGEIVVRSPFLATGYWKRDDLTAQVFAPVAGSPDLRTVRTGDLGHVDPDGCLHHHGRGDDMVKVAGFRVEPSEVERALRLQPWVVEAVVTSRPAGSSQLLEAYVVTDGDIPSGWRRSLGAEVPAHMVPAVLRHVPSLPRLASGKPDRVALRALASPSPEAAPRSPTESRLAAIWASLFGVEEVSRDADFFELGGTSLQAADLMARIHRDLGTDLPLAVLLHSSSVAALATLVDEGPGAEDWACLLPIRETGHRTPLIVVHGLWGTVLSAHHMAPSLHPDRPVYGIQSEALDGRALRPGTVEELAEHYCRLVRAIRPDGDLALFGFSFGGLIAYEMARQLRNSGTDVHLVILGDTLRPGTRTRNLSSRIGAHRFYLEDRPRLRRWTYVFERVAARARRHLGPVLASAFLAIRQRVPARLRRVYIEDRHLAASRRYEAQPYDGAVTLLRVVGDDRPEDLGWRDLVGRLSIVPMSGRHWDLMRPPAVFHAAEAIETELTKAEAHADA